MLQTPITEMEGSVTSAAEGWTAFAQGLQGGTVMDKRARGTGHVFSRDSSRQALRGAKWTELRP